MIFGDTKLEVCDMERPLDYSLKPPPKRSSPSPESSQSSSRKVLVRGGSAKTGNGAAVVKDFRYLKMREKNNAAAKKSRDARRQKEERTKYENTILKQENERLRFTLIVLQEHFDTCPNGPKLLTECSSLSSS